MPKHRQERLTKEILHEISLLLQDKVKDPRLTAVTVTDVSVSPDLRLATVYFTVLGGADERDAAMNGLVSALPFLRRELAQSLQMRLAPDLRFVYDSAWEEGFRIEQLLEQLKKDAES